ncbi:MAG: phospholipase D-like domain-containing protein [Candidatus Micrarchaeia archaeon]
MRDTQEQYSGSESFRYVDRLLGGNDKELLIISPYISDYYAHKLSKIRKKRIRIITSEGSLAEGTALGSLHKAPRSRYAKAILYLAVLAVIFAYLDILYAVLAVLLIAVLVLLFMARTREQSTNIEIKATGRQFIHEKMYVGDKMAIVGSANLTFSGMHKNIEHIEIIRDSAYIEKLRAHFEELWKTY